MPPHSAPLLPAEPLPVDPYIQSSGYWHDIGVEQSDGEDWKTTDMGWGVHPEGIRKMLAYIQVGCHVQACSVRVLHQLVECL